ncbi:MAG: PstS family phosphate ABC transporter substrate-binding protein [Methanobacteriota archaeon]
MKKRIHQTKKQQTPTNLLKITTILTTLLLTTIYLSGCTGQQQNTIKISGAFALKPMMDKWVAEYNKIHPEITIDVNANGAGQGMAEAKNKIVNIGMVSREINRTEIEQGIFWVSVAKDAVVATINTDNPIINTILITGVTKQQLKHIFITRTITTWGQLIGNNTITDPITVYTRSDSCGAAETWALYLGNYKQNDLTNNADAAVNGDNTLAATIQREQLGIGYNNIGYVYTKKIDNHSYVPADGIIPIPLDINENGVLDTNESFYQNRTTMVNAIVTNYYPSPPARALHLVTYKNFTGITKDFVQWILTDGQQYVLESGYIPLSEETITTQLRYVNERTRPETL